MRAPTPPDAHPGVTPAGPPWLVAAVEALPGWRLHVRFNDGLQGTVEMEREIHAPDADVFAELADPERFASVPKGISLTTGRILPRHAQHSAGVPMAGFVTALHTCAGWPSWSPPQPPIPTT